MLNKDRNRRSSQIGIVPGMRDATSDEYHRLKEITERFGSYLRDQGYEFIDTPLLEETELFTRKSGTELTSHLYTFTDPGGHRVSLRAEFTSSVIRHFIHGGESFTLPVRWQYAGPVFRYERGDGGLYRQYPQAGAELVGAGGNEADAEVLLLAWAGLQRTGLKNFHMRIGNVGVLHQLLSSYGLSDGARLFIVGNVQGLKHGPAGVARLTGQAREKGLLKDSFKPPASAYTDHLRNKAPQSFMESVLSEVMSSPTGRRTTGEIVDRLVRKVTEANDPAKFQAAMTLVSDIVTAEGSPASTLEVARDITRAHGIETKVLDDISRLMEKLADSGICESQLTLDFGLAREISYYTGVVFEFTSPDLSEGMSLGGGGRYDGLVRALGGKDIPTLGFAFSLDQVSTALAHQQGSRGNPSGLASIVED